VIRRSQPGDGGRERERDSETISARERCDLFFELRGLLVFADQSRLFG